MVGQHYNDSNPASHESTADEIWADFGEELAAIVCTTGTGGTISGLNRFLKPRNPNLEIVATEPADSPILSKGIACKHKIMGTAPGFIPDTLNTDSYERIIGISAQDAFAMTRGLAVREGIFAGLSCGAAVKGMLELADSGEYAGETILGILADTGERYLSTEVWDSL